MGAKTLTTVVSEGMALAGRDDLSTEVMAWVNNWLRQTYLSWDYPFLLRSREGLSLAAGTQTVVVGGGNGGVTPEIQRILDPVWVYKSDYTAKGQARIRPLYGGNDERSEERVQDATVRRGIPTQVRVRPSTTAYGVWTLVFLPVPDVAYLLALDYVELPATLAGADTPLYPNDLTLVQAALTATALYNNGHDSPEYQDAIQVLARRTAEDKARFGATPGVNDVLPLDGGVFR